MNLLLNAYNYGLLPVDSSPEFQLLVLIEGQRVSVDLRNCLATTKAGQLLDTQDNKLTVSATIDELIQQCPVPAADEQDFRIILFSNTSEQTSSTLSISHATNLPANCLNVGQLKISKGELIRNEDYIPPCTTLNSHLRLRSWTDQTHKLLSEAQRDAMLIVRKVCEKRGTEDARRAGVLAELIRDWCEQLAIALNGPLNQLSFTAYEQPPIYFLEVVTLATRHVRTTLMNLNNPATTGSVRMGDQLVLKYFQDWTNISPERLTKQGLDRVTTYAYDHADIYPHLQVITKCWTDLAKILNELSRLDYIGQKQQDKQIRYDSVVTDPNYIPSRPSILGDASPVRPRFTGPDSYHRTAPNDSTQLPPAIPRPIDYDPLPPPPPPPPPDPLPPPLPEYLPVPDAARHMPGSSSGPRLDIGSWIAEAYSALVSLPKLVFSSQINRRSSKREGSISSNKKAQIPPSNQPVDASAYAPERISRGDSFLIVATLHPPGAGAASDQLVNRIDSTLTRVTAKPLIQPLQPHQKITFSLVVNNLTVDESVQEIRWQGQLVSVEFLLQLPEEYSSDQVKASLYVSSNNIPLGSFKFAISVGNTRQPNVTKPADFIAFRKAFISYASANRDEVLKRVQALEANGQKVFMDLISLASGERWEPTIFNQIEASDVFYLFWSKEAKQSKWVEREWSHALSIGDRNRNQSPLIVPIILEGPPPPSPPEQLKHLHFNDRHLYYIGKS